MTLFEQLKSIPKVDMHINLTSSISTDLAFDLSDDLDMIDVLDTMREKNVMEYEQALKLPVKILRNNKNVKLAVNDLINRLKKNNVIYGELFLDLPLYNHRIDVLKLLNAVLETIKENNFNLQIVLVISSDFEKEDNLYILELFDKYKNEGVNGIYFHKNKMSNLSDYMYLFDRMIKNNYPYILNINSKVSSVDDEIYMHAKRIIYSLPTFDDNLKDRLRINDIILELSLTRFKESNIIDLNNYFIYNFIKEHVLFTITSCDMTTLNTDILNEWCLMFNNYPINLLEMIRIIHKSILKANISDTLKDKLIDELKNGSNIVV